MLIISFDITILELIVLSLLEEKPEFMFQNIHFKITTKLRVIHIFAIQMTLTCIAHIER